MIKKTVAKKVAPKVKVPMKDIPSAFDMKTGVDVGKGKKTMPTMPMKKMPAKSMPKKAKGKC